jgi:anti-anti-sigma factor
MTADTTNPSFRIDRRGDLAVIVPSPEVESMSESLIQQAAQLVLAPLKADPPAGLVIDLSQVDYFGSVFLSFLLRCYTPIKMHGSEMVLAGVSKRIRELLRLTNLDTLWAIYDSRDEALAALGGSD